MIPQDSEKSFLIPTVFTKTLYYFFTAFTIDRIPTIMNTTAGISKKILLITPNDHHINNNAATILRIPLKINMSLPPNL